MPKAVKFTPKVPIDKLPLAVRKNIRDNFELQKEDLQNQIAELVGVPFTININASEVLSYCRPGELSSAGGVFRGYVEGFIGALKQFLDTYGEDGKTHFNEAVSQSELAIAVNELGDGADTITADVQAGIFRILFHHEQLGYNQGYLQDGLLKAIETVPREGFRLTAKHSITNDYNAEIEELTQEIGEILRMPDVILDPNFEETYALLIKVEDKSWQDNFGRVSFAYFNEGLKYQLEIQGFKGDDMLQEGFAEVVTSKTFKIRVVTATKNGCVNETAIEDGVVYLQTTLERWGYNTSEMGRELLELL